MSAAQTVSSEVDAVGAVNEPVRGGAGIGWVAYEGVPIVARDLVGENSRAAPVAFPEDFLGVTTAAGVKRFRLNR